MKKRKSRIDAFVASGVQPTTTASGAVIARTGTRHQTLITSAGTRTALGAHYEDHGGTELPAGGYDTSQAPTREGDTEYILMRNGARKAVRRWDAAAGDYSFTAVGRSFYSRIKRNYVVQVPVLVKGTRKNGTVYSIRSSLPIAKMGVDKVELPPSLTASQRTARVKDIVRAKLDLTRPLYEVSQES